MRVSERRAALVDAALRVMKRDGVAAATTRAITLEADMPHGAFHYCFESKQHLMAEIFARDRGTVAEHAFPATPAEGDPRDAIAAALRGYWYDVVLADPREQLVMHELTVTALREPELVDAAREDVARHHEQLQRALQRIAGAALDTTETETLAALLFASFNGLILTWLASRDDALVDGCLNLLADQISNRVSAAR